MSLLRGKCDSRDEQFPAASEAHEYGEKCVLEEFGDNIPDNASKVYRCSNDHWHVRLRSNPEWQAASQAAKHFWGPTAFVSEWIPWSGRYRIIVLGVRPNGSVKWPDGHNAVLQPRDGTWRAWQKSSFGWKRIA